MKIQEIVEGLEEALAGTERPGFMSRLGFGSAASAARAANKASKQMQRAIENRVKQVIPRWYARVEQLTASGVEMDGSTPQSQKNYIDNLLLFARGKLPKEMFTSGPGFKIARQLRNDVRTGGFDEDALKAFLTKTIAHAQTLKNQPAATSRTPPTSAVPVGKKVPAGGVDYLWDGKNWIALGGVDAGKPAAANLATQITAIATSGATP